MLSDTDSKRSLKDPLRPEDSKQGYRKPPPPPKKVIIDLRYLSDDQENLRTSDTDISTRMVYCVKVMLHKHRL